MASFENRMLAIGVQAVRSFDLQAARAGLLDPSACACPYHGQDQCTCQYVVYLIYSDAPHPISVTVHGHDKYTDLSIQDSPHSNQEELWMIIKTQLESMGAPV